LSEAKPIMHTSTLVMGFASFNPSYNPRPSRRRRHAQVIGDPAVEIGQRAGAQRLLFGDGFFITAQPVPSDFRVGRLLSGDRAGQRR
jgi:hypothetical protein